MNQPGPDPQRVVVFIDYQNVMRDARRAFCGRPYGPADGQIDPLRYAQLLVSRQPLGTKGRRTLQEVRVYRGRPDPRKDAQTYAAHMRQSHGWEQAGVSVITRPLRYPRDWPKTRAEEKGIDVQVAIDAVMRAIHNQLDVAILATTDTDQRPVLEAFHGLPLDPQPIIEVATWRTPTFSKKLQVPGLHVWSHFLDDAAFRQVRDYRDYNIR
jgi:uncharacterized LabA/DUF88 family protein